MSTSSQPSANDGMSTTTQPARIGDIVRVGGGKTIWTVVEQRGEGACALLRLRSLATGVRATRFAGHVRVVESLDAVVGIEEGGTRAAHQPWCTDHTPDGTAYDDKTGLSMPTGCYSLMEAGGHLIELAEAKGALSLDIARAEETDHVTADMLRDLARALIETADRMDGAA